MVGRGGTRSRLSHRGVDAIDMGDELRCSRCGCEAYQLLEIGECREIDTIGSHRICSTSEGTYLHSYAQWSDDT